MLKIEDLLKLNNTDYQTRKGEYPKSNIPDSVTVDITSPTSTVKFAFKSTTEDDANIWYTKSKEMKIVNQYIKEYDISVSTTQDGDYDDDWILLVISLVSKDTSSPIKDIKQTKPAKSDDTSYTYCYILSTQDQRDAIDLTKHKVKLSKVIKEFFSTRLISLTIDKQSYTIKLKEEYTVGDKRKLGRAISTGTDLKKFVRTVAYNGGSDKSGQLFRLKKESDNAITK